ncbi:hypothetical protein D9611_013185 [Ephemerocybe angulata]|uniref:G domain-containing protein n=1 Tax=Ephemerocybe angulata TaxID=980116 RepID=A0A8H5BTQ6_9AGAR|nr:hypothetical protein D9611_013185 [Tulosesus angulatus]
MKEHTIVVLGRFEAGKTTFIKAVHDSATVGAEQRTSTAEKAQYTYTRDIVEYKVSLPDGQSLTFIDTPGFDVGLYSEGDESVNEAEEFLPMLEEHLAANGHMRFYPTRFRPDAQRAFENLFANAQIACITTQWDQMEDHNGPPFTAEVAQSKEESLYASGRASGSLLEYLHDRQNSGSDILRFRSGLPTEAYSSPQDIIHKLFSGPGSGPTLEERLAAVTQERDELAAKYAFLLQEREAQTTVGDAAPGPKEAVRPRTSRTRRQRLLDTINTFSAQVLEMVADLDREALDVAAECAANRDAIEAASAAIKVAESRLMEKNEDVKAAEEQCTRLKQGQDSLAELERSLSTELNGLEMSAGQRSVKAMPSIMERIDSSLKQAQELFKEREGWVSMVEDYYRKSCQEAEQAGAEIKKWKAVQQAKEKELNEWLSPASERLLTEREDFRNLEESLSPNLHAMLAGLKDSWEGKLGDNTIFTGHLGGYTVDPEMVARIGGDWAPAIELFYETQVTLALSQDMVKFHSLVLQRLQAQEATAQREWQEGINEIVAPVTKDLPSPPPPLILSGHTGQITSVAFSWDGTKIVSGAGDKTVRVWDVLTGGVRTVLKGHNEIVSSVAFSPDGRDVVSGSFDNTVRVWDALRGKVKRVLQGHSGQVWSVDFSPDGSRIVSGSKDQTVRIWDASTGEVQRVLRGHTKMINSAVFSGDASLIFSGSDDKSVRVWDAWTGEVLSVLNGHTSWVVSVASSKDGLQVVSGSGDKTAMVWDVLTGKVLRVLEGHGDPVYAVSFSRVGSWICSGSADKTLRVWDPSTGEVQNALTGHTDTVRAVAFSRDGRRIVSGSYDKTIRVWDMAAP